MEFDWTINVGHVLTAIGLLLVFGRVFFTVLRRLDHIEFQVSTMWAWFEKHLGIRNGKTDKGGEK